MFVKIFEQVFDSSIAENYKARHVFQDMLILCDRDGCVDMTPEAISRRTNVPIKIIKEAIEYLSKPDPKSRSKNEDGRRIKLIDSRRDWGWIIINYEHYRNLQDEEARRASWRDAKARQREMSKIPKRKRKTVDQQINEQLGYVIQTQPEKDNIEKIKSSDNPFNEED